jgi:hypothetical protein
MLGKVDLAPAFGPAQLSDALTRRRTDVLCHASMIELVFALYLAHTLFGFGKRQTVDRVQIEPVVDEASSMGNPHNPKWKWSAVVPIALLVGLPVGFYTAFVAQCYWNWFAASALHLPEISFLQMLGLWWMIDLLIIRPARDDGRAWALLASITELCVPPERQREMEEMRISDPIVEFTQGLSGAFNTVIGNTLMWALGFGLHLFIS